MAKKISAEKPKPAPRKRTAKAAAPKKTALTVSIDYPREGEIILAGHYAARMTSAGASQVQCRFNHGTWVDCREAVGHWWFEWMSASSKALLEARARSGKGRWTAAVARLVVVD